MPTKLIHSLSGIFLTLITCTVGLADESLTEQLEAAKNRVTGPSFDIRYKFKVGEVVRTRVEHLVTVETKIQGVSETAQTRSVSTKSWKIVHVDEQGNIQFIHQVDDVEMWQKVTDRPEVRFDSRSDKDVPPEYRMVAESVGEPLAKITMTPYGEITDRENTRPNVPLSIADLTVPLPGKPIRLGERWTVSTKVPVRKSAADPIKNVKTRQVYTLEQVKTGVATISVKTQLLTPVDDAAIKSKLVQRMQNGEIRFDIDNGRLLSKQMDLDETVQNFHGADSIMQYLARFTETLVKDEPKTATQPVQGPKLKR